MPERTKPEILEENERLADTLTDLDLNVKPYKVPPLGQNTAVLTQTRERVLRFWAGWANVKEFTNPDLRQAALVFDEEARKFSHKWKMKFDYYHQIRNDDGIRQRARVSFPVTADRLRIDSVTVHKDTKRYWSVSMPDSKSGYDINKAGLLEDDENSSGRICSATVTARASIPANTNAFLVGIDEHQQFISVLPTIPKSFKDAHEILRPDTVPKGSLRQGEWFFVPVNQKEEKAILRAINNGATVLHGPLERRRWENSTHFGTFLRVDDNQYAIGVIHDTRRGQHDPLILPTWHRVIRNTEVVNESAPVSRRYYD